VVIALVITPDGLPLAYEVLAGNTADKTTLVQFLATIEQRYGKARRTWIMDRGIPTQATLKQMREAGTYYLVGTPKSMLGKLAHSDARQRKEKAMRRRRFKMYARSLHSLRWRWTAMDRTSCEATRSTRTPPSRRCYWRNSA
jgi:transposase